MDEIELDLDEEMVQDLQRILSGTEAFFSGTKTYDQENDLERINDNIIKFPTE